MKLLIITGLAFCTTNLLLAEQNNLETLSGLWRCVRNVSYEGGILSEELATKSDLYITESQLYYFNYPCDGGPPVPKVTYHNDTLKVYRTNTKEPSIYEVYFINDTLVLHDFSRTEDWDYRFQDGEYIYFLSLEPDQNTVQSLTELKFSPECLNQELKFNSIRDSSLFSFFNYEDSKFNFVPQKIKFIDGKCMDYYIKGKYIYSSKREKPVFRIDYSNWWNYTRKIVKGMIAFTTVEGPYAGKYWYVYDAEYEQGSLVF